MYEVRVFQIYRRCKGGDRLIAVRLSRTAAETIVKGNPDLYFKREFGNKLMELTDIEKLRLMAAEKDKAA